MMLFVKIRLLVKYSVMSKSIVQKYRSIGLLDYCKVLSILQHSNFPLIRIAKIFHSHAGDYCLTNFMPKFSILYIYNPSTIKYPSAMIAGSGSSRISVMTASTATSLFSGIIWPR